MLTRFLADEVRLLTRKETKGCRLQGREVQERDPGLAASPVISYPCAQLGDGIVLEMVLHLEQGDCSCTFMVPGGMPGIPCPRHAQALAVTLKRSQTSLTSGAVSGTDRNMNSSFFHVQHQFFSTVLQSECV